MVSLNKYSLLGSVFLFILSFSPDKLYAFQKGLTNIALHKTVKASSEVTPASNAVNGDKLSYWQSGSSVGDHWIKVDLEKVYTINRVLLPRIRGVNHLVVEVRSEGDWQAVYDDRPDNVLIGFDAMEADAVRLKSIAGRQMRVYEIEVYPFDPQPVYVNQSGYDINRPKRFTAPLAKDGTRFQVLKKGENTTVYEGMIEEHIGDFTDFKPNDPGPYIVNVYGDEASGNSFPFMVAPALIEKVAYPPLLRFMVDVRCRFGDLRDYRPTDDNEDCPSGGIAWRDSHQFSFEIQSLVHLFFANPDAFESGRIDASGEYQGLRTELPEWTPEIIRLIHWAVDIYLRAHVDHTLIKGQLAYFVYAWPWMSDYIPRTVYEEAKDYLFDIWGQEEITRWRWYDIEHTGNLFQSYEILGTGKGEFPIGHSIVPNLLMYEVAKREGREEAEKFFTAAYNQTVWLIDNLDWNDPLTTKGQRQGEWVTITSFEHFLSQYPDRAPQGLKEKISEWADVAIQRSENMWDFRRYSDERWIIPGIGAPELERPYSGFNEPGNVGGFPAPAMAASWVIDDSERRERLKVLATSQMDNVFGRNPTGRHYSFKGAHHFEGVELGWFRTYEGGAGILETSRGVLDGSPKETTFPYNPTAGDPGWTEGWVTFNSAWNVGLAYMSADLTSIEVYDRTFSMYRNKARSGHYIGIELSAPLNFDHNRQETANVVVTAGNQKHVVELRETSGSSPVFRGSFQIPENINASTVQISYGYAWHETVKELAIQ